MLGFWALGPGIWTSKFDFILEARIWALGLGYGPKGWDMGLGSGFCPNSTKQQILLRFVNFDQIGPNMAENGKIWVSRLGRREWMEAPKN